MGAMWEALSLFIAIEYGDSRLLSHTLCCDCYVCECLCVFVVFVALWLILHVQLKLFPCLRPSYSLKLPVAFQIQSNLRSVQQHLRI